MITLTGVINDLHIPWHDHRSVELIIDAFQDIGIHRLIINGDLLDFLTLNKHSKKDPRIHAHLESELNDGLEFLQSIRRKMPDCEIIFIFGNHCDRFDRYLINDCPVFVNLLRLDKQLRLEELNIQWIDYPHNYRLEQTNLFFRHSPPSYGVNGAMTSLLAKLDVSYMYACTHRMQHAVRSGESGQTYHCWFNGWLGSVDRIRDNELAFKWTKGHQNWQQCASLITCVDGKDFHVEQSSIISDGDKRSVVFHGALYVN